jgi:hypothetical protein
MTLLSGLDSFFFRLYRSNAAVSAQRLSDLPERLCTGWPSLAGGLRLNAQMQAMDVRLQVSGLQQHYNNTMLLPLLCSFARRHTAGSLPRSACRWLVTPTGPHA